MRVDILTAVLIHTDDSMPIRALAFLIKKYINKEKKDSIKKQKNKIEQPQHIDDRLDRVQETPESQL